MKKPKIIPYDFVLEELGSLGPITKPMFGCVAVYVDTKIVLILRQKQDYVSDNGVWIATTADHHESLKRDLPIMRSIALFNSGGPTGWQNLPEDDPRFEEMTLKVCALIRENDPRIGKIPKPKKLRPKISKTKSGRKKVAAKKTGIAKGTSRK